MFLDAASCETKKDIITQWFQFFGFKKWKRTLWKPKTSILGKHWQSFDKNRIHHKLCHVMFCHNQMRYHLSQSSSHSECNLQSQNHLPEKVCAEVWLRGVPLPVDCDNGGVLGVIRASRLKTQTFLVLESLEHNTSPDKRVSIN